MDASDIISLFAHAAFEHTKGRKHNFSNWIQSDLNNSIALLENSTPSGLVDFVCEAAGLGETHTVLDFGCGSAPHRCLLEAKGMMWRGLDYDASIDPTATHRQSDLDAVVTKYDGSRFPFDDGAFDAVWSFQSLEHVNSAEETFSEISRVLRNGGAFFGSTSFLEPYHARSTYCYTPYGFKLLCQRNGLDLKRLFPSVDGVSLVMRHLFMMLGADEEDYGNWGKMMHHGGAMFKALRERSSDAEFALDLPEAMAQICGQFYFFAKRI